MSVSAYASFVLLLRCWEKRVLTGSAPLYMMIPAVLQLLANWNMKRPGRSTSLLAIRGKVGELGEVSRQIYAGAALKTANNKLLAASRGTILRMLGFLFLQPIFVYSFKFWLHLISNVAYNQIHEQIFNASLRFRVETLHIELQSRIYHSIKLLQMLKNHWRSSATRRCLSYVVLGAYWIFIDKNTVYPTHISATFPSLENVLIEAHSNWKRAPNRQYYVRIGSALVRLVNSDLSRTNINSDSESSISRVPKHDKANEQEKKVEPTYYTCLYMASRLEVPLRFHQQRKPAKPSERVNVESGRMWVW